MRTAIALSGSLTLLLWSLAAVQVPAQATGPIEIREDFRPGYQYHVNCHVNIKGELILPAEKGTAQPARIAVTGKSHLKYDERVLALKGDQVDRTVRFYEQMEFDRQAGAESQSGSLRKAVRRLVILRHKQYEVPFSPDGPLLWEEIDMVRTDVFTPALRGLLPATKVRPGDSWVADPSAVQELTDLEALTTGQLTCVFDGITTPVAGRPCARIRFRGKVSGVNEDGLARHDLEGSLLFDLTSKHLSYLTMKGTQLMLDKSGNPTGGRIEGTFVLTREPNPDTVQLTDVALKGLALEPNEKNTLLWYVSPEVGASFLYPRHWHVGGANSKLRQVGLDEKRGNGILITADAPQNAPAVAKLQQEARADLQKQGVKITKIDAPRALSAGIDTFSIEAEAASRRFVLQYFLVRQKAGYAVVTANLQRNDLAAMRGEAEGIARSLVLMAPKRE